MVGEHIRALKGGRWIHAIDCGDETVLHLVEDVAPPRVRRAYRPEFVAGAACVEHVTHRERTFAPKEVVRRAYSRATDPALATMFRDSEAFAEWCTSGRLPGPRNVALGVPGVSGAEARPAPRHAAPRKASTPRKPASPRKASALKAKRGAKKVARPALRRPSRAAKTAKRAARPAKRKGARR
jgi:hypothetical protein